MACVFVSKLNCLGLSAFLLKASGSFKAVWFPPTKTDVSKRQAKNSRRPPMGFQHSKKIPHPEAASAGPKQ